MMPEAEETVQLSVEDHVAILTLNRPEKLNALSAEMFSAFEERLDEIAADVGIRVVVLTGAGRAFCAGADMGGSAGPRTSNQIREGYERTSRRQLKLLELPQPVIAAVHGYCLG